MLSLPSSFHASAPHLNPGAPLRPWRPETCLPVKLSFCLQSAPAVAVYGLLQQKLIRASTSTSTALPPLQRLLLENPCLTASSNWVSLRENRFSSIQSVQFYSYSWVPTCTASSLSGTVAILGLEHRGLVHPLGVPPQLKTEPPKPSTISGTQ